MFGIVLILYGIWILISGKLPAGKKYRIEGTGARIVGGILLMTYPTQIFLQIVLTLVSGGTPDPMYSFFLAIGSVIAMLVLAAVVSRLVRIPVVES